MTFTYILFILSYAQQPVPGMPFFTFINGIFINILAVGIPPSFSRVHKNDLSAAIMAMPHSSVVIGNIC